MKNVLLIVSIFLCSFKSVAPSSALKFKDLADMPTGLGATTSAADGKYIYVSNGFSLNELRSGLVEKYEVANNGWTVLSSALIPKLFPSSAIIGNSLYIFDGDLIDKALNKKVEVVNTKTGDVSFATDNPQPVHAGGIAVGNNLIYTFGGKTADADPVYTNNLFSYDPAADKWTKLASMPEAKEAKGVVVKDKLYVIGGYNGKVSNRIDMYDIKTDSWSQLIDMPVGISANSVTSSGDKIYTLFDFTNQTYIGCYDISSNTYSAVEQINLKARRHAGAHIINNKLYVVGGNTTDKQNSCLSSLQVADLK